MHRQIRTWVAVLLLGAALTAAGACHGARPRPGLPEQPPELSLVVNLSERRLYVMERGHVVDTHPVAVGMPTYPTPPGRYSIDRVIWNPAWVPPQLGWAAHAHYEPPGSLANPMGNVEMLFRSNDYYLHGTRDYDSLGKAESHGCVRLANPIAIELAQSVMASGGSPESPDWVSEVLASRETRRVNLRHPIELLIQE